MTLYFKFFGLHLKSQMQFKSSFFLTMLGQLLVPFTGFLGVYFMFLRFHEVDGFTLSEVLLCFAVILAAFSLAEVFGRGFDVFPRMIGNGEFDRALVRPRGVIFQIVASKMEFTRFGRVVYAVILFFYAIPNSNVIWSWDKVVTLSLMVLCGAVVFFCLFIIYAGFTFFTIEGLEFMNVVTHGGQEFGRYPFSIYGNHVLKFVTYVVPFALVQYYPLLYLLGMEQSKFYMFIPLLSLLFIIPSYGFFRFGLHNYKSTGS